jgi:hypothetical protein
LVIGRDAERRARGLVSSNGRELQRELQIANGAPAIAFSQRDFMLSLVGDRARTRARYQFTVMSRSGAP